MTNSNPATVAESLTVHGVLYDGKVDMQLYVKDRDARSQHLTLDVKIDGLHSLVATSSTQDIDQALNEVRDEMIRQIDHLKTKREPRNNKHLRDTPRR